MFSFASNPRPCFWAVGKETVALYPFSRAAVCFAVTLLSPLQPCGPHTLRSFSGFSLSASLFHSSISSRQDGRKNEPILKAVWHLERFHLFVFPSIVRIGPGSPRVLRELFWPLSPSHGLPAGLQGCVPSRVSGICTLTTLVSFQSCPGRFRVVGRFHSFCRPCHVLSPHKTFWASIFAPRQPS